MAQSNVIFRQLGKDGPTGISEDVLLLAPSNNFRSIFGAMACQHSTELSRLTRKVMN